MKKKNKQNKTILILVISSILVLGFIILSSSGNKDNSANASVKGVESALTNSIDGIQEATINVRGGYLPKSVTLEANKPSRLKMITKNTYDCSASLVIPSLNINTNLPASGTTSFDIKAQKPGTEITGSCSMGMYAFKIKFI